MEVKESLSYNGIEYSVMLEKLGNMVIVRAVNRNGDDILIQRNEDLPPLTLSGILSSDAFYGFRVDRSDPGNSVNLLLRSMEDKIRLAIDMGFGINI